MIGFAQGLDRCDYGIAHTLLVDLVVGAYQFDGLTRAFVHLNDLPSCPLDRLSRYEAALWRQACQILFTLQCLSRHKPWDRLRFR